MEVCNFIKKDTLAQVFFCEFCKFSKSSFLEKTFGWMLVYIINFALWMDPHKCNKLMIFFMLWHRTNSSVLITKFLKIPRIVNAIILRKFKNLFSWFEIEISSFSSFFSLFFLSSFSHLHFWLSVIIRATLWQRTISIIHQI